MQTAEIVPRQALDAERWPAFLVDCTGTVVLANRAWDRMAAGAGGPRAADVVGSRWLDHVHGDELHAFYTELFHRMCAGGAAEDREAPCNTPDRFRLFRYHFEPVRERSGTDVRGVLVLSTLVGEGPIEDQYRLARPELSRYRQPSNLILQCGACRRVNVAGSSPREWDLVPEYVAHPRPDVTHGLCGLCRELYYGPRHGRA